MANVGIEFTMKDGSKDSYDPVDYPDYFKEEEESYFLQLHGRDYEIKKEEVQSFRTYELCPECGYEAYETGCSNYSCSLCTDK